jgi:hypothetical protein
VESVLCSTTQRFAADGEAPETRGRYSFGRIVLDTHDGRRVVFDAKFKTRLGRKGWMDGLEHDDSEVPNDQASFALEDVAKMHAYRDALQADSAWALTREPSRSHGRRRTAAL